MQLKQHFKPSAFTSATLLRIFSASSGHYYSESNNLLPVKSQGTVNLHFHRPFGCCRWDCDRRRGVDPKNKDPNLVSRAINKAFIILIHPERIQDTNSYLMKRKKFMLESARFFNFFGRSNLLGFSFKTLIATSLGCFFRRLQLEDVKCLNFPGKISQEQTEGESSSK